MTVGALLVTLGATVVTVHVLGPWGIFPALLMVPLVVLWELLGWFAQGESTRSPAPEAEASGDEAAPASQQRSRSATTQPATGSPPHTSLTRRLRAIHVEDPASPLRERAIALQAFLARHFAAEESPTGFYADLRRLDPTLVDDVAALVQEHRALEAQLAELTQPSRVPEDQLRDALSALVGRVLAHQRREDALFARANGIELGEFQAKG
jgi:hypothetical protein